ncbi:hypothetical protein [Salinicola halophyticus]|uniref:hypothetical protein n=1 Tax=Salinicola halophyticus TaxID=1808881 RepID=UPI000DA24B36|nr:hypothetical protein [Salinicola halophyticus]
MTWTLEMDALDPGGDPVTLRYSLGRYDDSDDNAFDPRIDQPGHFKAGLFAGALIAGDRSSYGETTLINADGGLDYLADYAVDGRAAVIRRGTGSDRVTVLAGTVARLSFETAVVSVVLRGPLEPLQTPHPQPTYAGDNVLPDGLEGTADDIAGQAKPLVFGEVANATPVAVNTARLIYQLSARDDCEITAVYDNGAELTRGSDYASASALQGTAPAAGEWRAYRGFVRLGASPVGTITVDATTSAPNAGDVFSTLASERDWNVNAADVADLNTLGAVRLYVTDQTDTLDLVDRIAVSVGGYLNLEPDGTLRCRRLAAPEGEAPMLQQYAIRDIRRSATGAGANSLPVGRVTLNADRIETTQTNVAGSVSSGRRARLAKQTRQAVAENAATRERHPLAGELQIDSVLASLSSAQSVADDLAAILGVRRDVVTVSARVEDLPDITVGELRTVVTPRLGYGDGRVMLVTGYLINAQSGDIDLNLWG